MDGASVVHAKTNSVVHTKNNSVVHADAAAADDDDDDDDAFATLDFSCAVFSCQAFCTFVIYIYNITRRLISCL
jgi:hypothetical protein